DQQECLTTGGFILTYLSLASSNYQLPHYIFVAFPLCAIITAKFLKDSLDGHYRTVFSALRFVQIFVVVVLLGISLLTFVFVFKAAWWHYVVWTIGALVCIVIATSRKMNNKLIWTSTTAMLLTNIFMTHHFYPELLKFQLGSQIGRFIKEQKIPPEKFYSFQTGDAFVSGNFYAEQSSLGKKDHVDFAPGDYILTSAAGLDTIKQKAQNFELVKQG